MEGGVGVKGEVGPPGSREQTSESRGQHLHGTQWLRRQMGGGGLAPAEGLRLETAYLRWDICCQLLGVAGTWGGAGGGGAGWAR